MEMKAKRKGYMSISQKQQLVEIMSGENDLRCGKFSANFTKKIADAKWNSIAEKLNAIPGGSKSAQEWKKTWTDLKTKTKGKIFQIKKYTNATGEGSSCSTQLNEVDEQILSLINPTTISGHTDVVESCVDLNFKNVLEISGDENTNNEYIEPANYNNGLMITESNISEFNHQETELTIDDTTNVKSPVTNQKRLKKYQKPRSLAAARLVRSVTATDQLAELGEKNRNKKSLL